MEIFESGKIRNVGIAAHGGAGKTSLAEAILFDSGFSQRLGKTDDGSTITDYLPEEIKRKVTISSALAPVVWQKHKLNFIDTPGYADFIGEVISTLRAVDGLLMVVCGVSGVEVQTEIIWDFAQEIKMPRMIFVNKLDRENSCFETVVEELRGRYGTGIVPVHIPIGAEGTFSGVVDVLSQKAYTFEKGQAVEIPIPENLAAEVEHHRTYLIEVAAESCDELLLKYLEGEAPTDHEIITAFKIGINNGDIYPVLAGSALNNIGISTLLDAVVDFLPAPTESKNELVAENAPKAIVFKTLADPFVGKLSFLRILNGTFHASDGIYNMNAEHEEKVNNFIVLRGKNQETVSSVNAGDIVAVAKLQDTQTGHTLTTKNHQVTLCERIIFPEPNLTVAISPKTRGDEDKMGNALSRLLEEDPTLKVEKNLETKEILIKGLGDLHLDIVAERFKNKFGVDVALSTPKIPYRETVKQLVKVQGRHKKQSGGAGQFGDVWLQIEPYPYGDFLFEEDVFGGAVPKNYFPAVEKGVHEAMSEGILAGYPVTNVKVTLYDGSYHPVDSNEMSFKIAGSLAFKKGAALASPVLLEPIMALEILVPEHYMGDILGDLSSKRGKIIGMHPHENNQVIDAQAPMAELQQYAIDLKAMTQGRGQFTMVLDHYEEVPAKIAESIIATKTKA